MKYIISILLVVIFQTVADAQHFLDSLRRQLDNARNEDTIRVRALGSLADYYGFLQFDSCLYYATRTADLSEKLNYPIGRFIAYRSRFFAFNTQGNFPRALEAVQNIQKTAPLLGNERERDSVLALSYYFLGLLNNRMGEYPKAIALFHQAIGLQDDSKLPMQEMYYSFSQLGNLYLQLKKLDSAKWYTQKGYLLSAKSVNYQKYRALAIAAYGDVMVASGEFRTAKDLFFEGIKQSGSYNNIYFQARNYNGLAALFERIGQRDSCIYYARISLGLCLEHNFQDFNRIASGLLSNAYESDRKTDSAFKYLKIMVAAKDSVSSQSKGREFQQFAFNEIQRLQAIGVEKERTQNQIKMYGLMAALAIFLLIAFILYRGSQQKQKAKTKIEKAYAELKSTQSQLIQSEKMASLGELTAGIAHEIQNPLNFVNNFSEVNRELIQELKNELLADNKQEAISIAGHIDENEQKIIHHGKRADSIVKGMLQHSRESAGQKEPTDINALADEYLRLSFQGLRAKDKAFNASLQTNFDQSIGNINIIPQDIGRVLLNLYSNAFYAVSEKKKQQPDGYEPTVSISTIKVGDKVEIKVKDNGNGIPDKIKGKIFQPFFTTKPTGQGTGLGLSLSYDIIIAHGGEIKVDTREGEFTEFVIQLPIPV